MCVGSQYSKKVLHLRRAILKTQASRLGLRPHRLAWVLSTACLKCKTSTNIIAIYLQRYPLTAALQFNIFRWYGAEILKLRVSQMVEYTETFQENSFVCHCGKQLKYLDISPTNGEKHKGATVYKNSDVIYHLLMQIQICDVTWRLTIDIRQTFVS